jgi:hypothetical protein
MKKLLTTAIVLCSQTMHAGDVLNVCVNYHCEQQQQVTLEESDWHLLLQPFSQPVISAENERKSIRQAVARFEQLIGDKTPTHNDQPENLGEDEVGQLDCIAESKNTLHYLQWLERKHQLKWHTVGQRIRRAPAFLDVHWAAVITEIQTGENFIVDSWYGGNGELPAIQPQEQWLKKAPVAETSE